MKPLQTSRPSRWAWALAILVAGGVVACESSLSVGSTGSTWGFVYVDATLNSSDQPETAPKAEFFNANISAIPNALQRNDTCNDVAYSAPGQVSGVTFMDAGDQVTMVLGGQTIPLARTTTVDGSVYQLAGGPISYVPGDSVIVTVPGAVGGFPAGDVRGKTAEAFTFDPVTVPTGTHPIQLRWSRADDFNSAMIVELRYAPASTGGVISREVLCAFNDDGVDSIPFDVYQNWSDQTNTVTEVVATRLRTSFKTVTNGILEVISTYQVPTPPSP
jgi:hypothetical protein